MNYKLEYFEKHNDERGQLVVFLKNSNLDSNQKEFGQIYFITFSKKNTIRGNHYHKLWCEWFGVVTGKVEVVLKNMKTGEIEKLILDGNSDKYVRLKIGPNIAHAFRNMTPNTSLLNYANTEWSAEDTFSEIIIQK